MPFWSTVFGFFKAAGSTLGVGGTLGNVIAGITGFINISSLVVGVKGFLQARQMLAKGQDILANKTSAGGKLPIIYGNRRVGAQVIYMDVNANNSQELYVVYALSVGECDEILGRTIELDGNPLTDSARFRIGGYIGSDKISSGSGSLNTVSQNGDPVEVTAGGFGTNPSSRYMYVMNLHHGSASQTADPMLVASMSNWTSAHRLDGVCYIAAHYNYDTRGMWKGIPQLTVQVRGKKVYDPRLDSTAGGSGTQRLGTPSTYAFSDNPSLTFLDYITNNEYGKGLTASQLNLSTFSTAANTADTLVDNPFYNGTAQAFTWSGNAGQNFISTTSSSLHWWSNKIGETLTLTDAGGNTVLSNAEIIDVQRYRPYGGSISYLIFFNQTLSSSYASQTGTSLNKVKRFHCNGYVDGNKTVMENSKELLANMRGIFLYVDGKYELTIEDTGSSTFSITDNHIIADAGISVDYGNKDKKANKVIVEFFNGNKKYELDTATVLHDASPEYYSDDGDEILEIKAEFPFVSDPYIAYNMAKAILVRSRNQTTMQFLGTPEMYKLNVGDIVDLTYAGLGFSGKVCRVEALELQSDGLVSVSLIEYFDVYTWEVPPQEALEELSDIPSAYAVGKPTNVIFIDTDSSNIDRPVLTWDAPTDYPSKEFRVDVVDSSANPVFSKIVDTNSADLAFIPKASNYVASVTSINTLGVESDSTDLTFTVGDEPVAVGDVQANAITANEINVSNLSSISADFGTMTAGTINAQNVTVSNFTAEKISGDIDKLEPVSLTPNQSISTSYTTLAIITLPAPDLTTAGNGHTPFFSLVLSATLSGGGAQMDIKCQLLGTPIGGSSQFYTAAESGQDHNFSSGSISQSVSGSFNQKVGSACYLYVQAKRNAGTITVDKIQGIYAGLRGG